MRSGGKGVSIERDGRVLMKEIINFIEANGWQTLFTKELVYELEKMNLLQGV